jgi:hypothetical protein
MTDIKQALGIPTRNAEIWQAVAISGGNTRIERGNDALTVDGVYAIGTRLLVRGGNVERQINLNENVHYTE